MVLNCRDWVTYSPIGIFGEHVGILRIIVAFSFLFTMSLVLFWSNIQIRNARSGLIEPILFPSYVRILYGVGLINLFTFILIVVVEAHVNDYDAQLLYCLAIALQHTVTEGIAFIFLQKGCGIYSRKNSQKFAFVWFIISFVSSYLIFMDYAIARYIGWTIWLLIVIFYGLMWLLPAKTLFRRPAGISYARFWFWYRALMFLFYCFILLDPPGTRSWGYCGVLVLGLIGHALFHPLIIYRSLVDDSRWWQGIISHVTTSSASNPDPHDEAQPSVTDMRSPLLGVDFSIHVASALAEALDYMGERKAVKIINFAQIQITSQRRLLGRGSFSKVFRGMYNGEPCAVKLIYTSDLTEEVISRVTTEATILSAASSVNIVKILGIAVLPPSVCMVLELCTYGSLSDVLRGNDNGKSPILLKPIDKIFLALGCARGVAALHSLSDKIVHRDIKSFNFLVDWQFNAKLADLELGINTMLVNDQYPDEDAPTVDDFLVNWVAPEVLQGAAFSQQSDIYSLALVLYEIATTLVPYDDVPVIRNNQRQSIKDLVISGYRPELSNLEVFPRYLDLIEKGWSQSVTLRPSAQDMVEELHDMSKLFMSSVCDELMHAPEVAQTISQWLQTIPGKEYIKNLNTSYRDDTINVTRRSIRESFTTSRNQSILLLSQQSQYDIMSVISNEQFLTIQNVMNSNIDWMKIETVPEPICIITSSFPFIILKSSNSLLKLLNISNSNHSNDLFGQTLRSLICPPPPHRPSSSQQSLPYQKNKMKTSSSSNEFHDEIQKNRQVLDEFYMKLESNASSSSSSSSSDDYHCILNLFLPSVEQQEQQQQQQQEPIPFLIYAFPIYYRELVYQEYYPGLVSILPESIGTTFSSEYGEYSSKLKGNSSPSIKQNKFQRLDTTTSATGSTTTPFPPTNGILYYQLQFHKIEYQVPTTHESDNQNTTLIQNFTRMFSTSSMKSSSIFNRTDTTNTTNSQRLFSTSSGISNYQEKWKSRESGVSSSKSFKIRRSNNSQSTVSISSRGDILENNNTTSTGDNDDNDALTLPRVHDDKDLSTRIHEEIKSEKSLGEYDSLEGGLMLERTNTDFSLKSLNSDTGWANKY